MIYIVCTRKVKSRVRLRTSFSSKSIDSNLMSKGRIAVFSGKIKSNEVPEDCEEQLKWPFLFRGGYVNVENLTYYEAKCGDVWQVIGSAGCAVRDDVHSSVKQTLSYGTSVIVESKPYGSKDILISEPVKGYISLVENMGKGLGVIPGNEEVFGSWCYRVICTNHALVRKGLSLTSYHVMDLPFQSIFEVLERRINAQEIPRLRTVNGWISESFNPLSGLCGSIVEALSLPKPLRYTVVRKDGIPVTRGVEVVSPFVRIIPFGYEIEVCHRKFSEFPADSCVQRLKLSDGTGWVSLRVTQEESSESEEYVRFLGLSHTIEADPKNLNVDWVQNKSEKLYSEKSRKMNEFDLTEEHDNCIICLVKSRTSTLVHGDYGHIACCTECARILQARGDPCPVCREPIEKVIQNFWA